MSEWKILIYDGNQGQFRAGLGPWENLADWKKQSLLEQDKDAPLKVQSLEEFFYGLNVQWKEVTTYEECRESISDVHILVVFKGRVDRQLLNRGINLKEIHVLGYHSAEIDKEVLENRGIRLTYYPLTNFLAVAEHTIALILSLLKRIQEADRISRQGSSWMVIPGNVQLMRELTVGVLGIGEIGYEVTRLLKPWGSRLLYHDLHHMPDLEIETGASYVSWRELFEKSDIVSIHLPLNELTKKSIGAREFDWMKPNAIFINTARGEIVDETALVAALQSGKLRGAALDVFSSEPLSTDHPLTSLPNVILTPHIAWAGPWTLVNDAKNVFTGVLKNILANTDTSRPY